MGPGLLVTGTDISWIERILAIISGLLLIYPEGFSDLFGLVLFVGLLLISLFIKNMILRNRKYQDNHSHGDEYKLPWPF